VQGGKPVPENSEFDVRSPEDLSNAGSLTPQPTDMAAGKSSGASNDSVSAVPPQPSVPFPSPEPEPPAAAADSDALYSLYRQAVHMPEPEPEYLGPDQPITRMTHHELKAMRSKSVETEVKVPFQTTFANFVIRSIDELLQTFRKSTEVRRPKCLDAGHQCVHCGKQFAIEKKKDKEESEEKAPKRRE
jgi:hypothetical protein